MATRTAPAELLLSAREIGLGELFDLVFGHARADSFIAIGTGRPSKYSPSAPRFFTVLPADEYRSALPFLESVRPEETKYFCPNTLQPQALLFRPRHQYSEGLRSGVPMYFQFYNRHIRELCALQIDLDVGRGGNDLSTDRALHRALENS